MIGGRAAAERVGPLAGSVGWRLLIAVSVSMIVASLGPALDPIVSAALIEDIGWSSTAAGSLATAEFFCAAVAGLVAWAAVGPLGPRRMGLAALLAAFAGYGLAAVGDGPLLVVGRIVAGCGAGTALVAAAAAVAVAKRPERISGAAIVLANVVGIGLFLVVPRLTDGRGVSFVFVVVAGLSAAALALAWTTQGFPLAAVAFERRSLRNAPDRAASLLLMASAAMFSAADGALWHVTERIGNLRGLDDSSVGVVLALASVGSVVGGGIAVVVGHRLGNLVPLLGAVAVESMARLATYVVADASVYVVSQVMVFTAYSVAVSYYLGAAARLDDLGRWSAGVGAAIAFGTAVGPISGSVLLSAAGFARSGWFLLLVGGAAMVTAVPACALADRLHRVNSMERPVQ